MKWPVFFHVFFSSSHFSYDITAQSRVTSLLAKYIKKKKKKSSRAEVLLTGESLSYIQFLTSLIGKCTAMLHYARFCEINCLITLFLRDGKENEI